MNNEILVDNNKSTFANRIKCFFKSVWQGFKISLVEKKHLYLSFLLPVGIMFLVFAFLEMFPFGTRSILTVDMDGQYIYFFEQLRDIYTGKESIFYSFERSLGGEFLGCFTYYLASPLSFIVVLFPNSMVTEAVMIMMVLKCGFSGLTFSIFLEKTRKKNTLGFVIFSVMYALCSYATMFQFNTMWVDALIWLPLIALGVHSIVTRGKFKLYIISLTLAICSNYYIGYMLCIFVAIYFFVCLFSTPKESIEVNNDLHGIKSFIRIAVYSVIALMIAAVVVFSAYYSLQFGKTSYQENSFDPTLRFDALNLLTKMFVGSFDTVRLEGTPNIYAGVLLLLLLPAFYASKKVTLREKIFYTAFAVIFVASFSINTLDLVWHGFQTPVWFNYRYSFMFSFVMLVMAYRGFEELDVHRPSFFGKVAIALIGILLVIQKTVTLTRYEWEGDWIKVDFKPDLSIVWLSTLFILAYLLIVFARKHFNNKRVTSIVLLLVVCVEAFSNSFINWLGIIEDGGCASRNNYREFVDRMEAISSDVYERDSSFYRMEHTIKRKANDNLVANINGISEFTSTFNNSSVSFIKRLGFYCDSPTVIYLSGNPVTDSLLGIKYVIGSTTEDTNGTLPGLNSINGMYKDCINKDGFVVYENPYVFPLAFRVDGNLNTSFKERDFFEDNKSPFSTINNLLSSMLGKDTNVFQVCDYTRHKEDLKSISLDEKGGISFRKNTSDETGSFYFKVTANENGNIYMYLPSPYTTIATLMLNDEVVTESLFVGENTRIFDLGYYEKGDTIQVKLKFSHYRIYLWDTKNYFVQVDEDVLKEMSDTFNANGLQIEEYSDTKFVGKVNSSSNGTIFTSIPYDENWRVYINGKRVETYELVDSMLGFDIGSGEFDVEIKYVHTPFIIGSVISVVGIGLFVLLCLFEKRKKKNSLKNNGSYEDFDYYDIDDGEIDLSQVEDEIDDYSIEDDENLYDELSEENNDIPS
ncbi:MAG: YfhO family protein [Clostridia bacterium]|nr:YfhO family protein [Clostridia bacterium]